MQVHITKPLGVVGLGAALWLALAVSGGEPEVITGPLANVVHGMEVHNASAAQVELVEWAADRFIEHDLSLPPSVTVVFPPTPACDDGKRGIAVRAAEGGRIEVCTPAGDFSAGTPLPIAARRTILHELGHVWSAEFLDQDTRQAFCDQRGIEAWNQDNWESSGDEHAAEVMMWALLDETLLTGIACESWREAFTTLTGMVPRFRTECLIPLR